MRIDGSRGSIGTGKVDGQTDRYQQVFDDDSGSSYQLGWRSAEGAKYYRIAKDTKDRPKPEKPKGNSPIEGDWCGTGPKPPRPEPSPRRLPDGPRPEVR